MNRTNWGRLGSSSGERSRGRLLSPLAVLVISAPLMQRRQRPAPPAPPPSPPAWGNPGSPRGRASRRCRGPTCSRGTAGTKNLPLAPVELAHRLTPRFHHSQCKQDDEQHPANPWPSAAHSGPSSLPNLGLSQPSRAGCAPLPAPLTCSMRRRCAAAPRGRGC